MKIGSLIQRNNGEKKLFIMASYRFTLIINTILLKKKYQAIAQVSAGQNGENATKLKLYHCSYAIEIIQIKNTVNVRPVTSGIL